MNRFVKPIALLGLAGAMTVGALAPQAEARNGRWAAGAAGFAPLGRLGLGVFSQELGLTDASAGRSELGWAPVLWHCARGRIA